MMRRFFCMVLLAASVMASPAHAAMSAVNPTLLQNLDIRPKKVVLPPPQMSMCELIPAPALAAAELNHLDAHIGPYDRVAHSVFIYNRGEQTAWAHKKHEFDYNVGPGLAFLREQTDAVLIELGSNFISSGGRRAAFVAGMALGISCRWARPSSRPAWWTGIPAAGSG